MTSARAVAALEMIDDRFDDGASSHVSFDLVGDARLLAGGVDGDGAESRPNLSRKLARRSGPGRLTSRARREPSRLSPLTRRP